MKLQVDPGTFLAAWPDLQDPSFMHAVLLMCQHSEEGAYGLVVNRPAGVPIRTLMPEHPILGQSEFPIFLGGPVDHTTLQFIHRLPEDIPGGFPLTDEIWMGGDLEALAEIVGSDQTRAASAVRLFVGYSGWGPGQLESELRERSWIPAPACTDVVFSSQSEVTWRRVVRSIGPEGSALLNLPPDVSWN